MAAKTGFYTTREKIQAAEMKYSKDPQKQRIDKVERIKSEIDQQYN